MSKRNLHRRRIDDDFDDDDDFDVDHDVSEDEASSSDLSVTTVEEDKRPALVDFKFGGERSTLLHAGLHLVMAPSGAGKSKFLSELYVELAKAVGADVVDMIFMDEPDWRSNGDSIHFLRSISNEGDLNAEGKTVIIIDSIKDVLYSGGNLTKGGVSLSGIQLLAKVSAVFERKGVVCVAALNPQQDLDFESLIKSIKGNSTSISIISDGNIVSSERRVWNGKFYSRFTDAPAFLAGDYKAVLDSVSTFKDSTNIEHGAVDENPKPAANKMVKGNVVTSAELDRYITRS